MFLTLAIIDTIIREELAIIENRILEKNLAAKKKAEKRAKNIAVSAPCNMKEMLLMMMILMVMMMVMILMVMMMMVILMVMMMKKTVGKSFSFEESGEADGGDGLHSQPI